PPIADFDLEFDKPSPPPPNHPILGTPYAIPLDGTSQTVDLARSMSAPVTGVGFGSAVDPATFVANPTRRLVPAVGPSGARTLLEGTDTITLASDGPGGAGTPARLLPPPPGHPYPPPRRGHGLTPAARP